MVGEWIRAGLDLILIIMVGVGLAQATRLIRHLVTLRQGRIEMERFVREFNVTVIRAEAGIKGLRMAARESGDDLEKLVEKAVLVRDDLSFIVQSADHIAERLSQSAAGVVRPEAQAAKSAPQPAFEAKATTNAKDTPVASLAAHKDKVETPPSSKAEKELLQVLQKMK